MSIEVFHKTVGIELLDVPNSGFFPKFREDLLGTNHRWDAGGVGNGLRADFREAFFVIADVVDVDRLGFTVLETGDDISDAGAAFGGLAEVARIRQDGLEKLKGDDFHALVNDWVNPRHTDVLEHFEVL